MDGEMRVWTDVWTDGWMDQCNTYSVITYTITMILIIISSLIMHQFVDETIYFITRTSSEI